MAATLPRPVRLKLERALSQWRVWRCDPPLTGEPPIVSVLGQGLSNFSILVGDQVQFVVRIDGINPTSHGLNRQSEWRALQAASNAGIAPRPRYFNPELGCLVCDYLVPDKPRETNITEVATLLRKIHQLPARHNRLDLGEKILRYERQLEHAGRELPPALSSSRQAVFAILTRIRDEPAPAPVLCHNDLLQTNRISSGGQLWAIDWEYCAMGSHWYDLAVVSAGDTLSTEQTGALLEAYLDRPWTPQEWAQMHQYACLYRYLELLWYLVPGSGNLPDPTLEEKLLALEQALLSP